MTETATAEIILFPLDRVRPRAPAPAPEPATVWTLVFGEAPVGDGLGGIDPEFDAADASRDR